MCYHTHVIIHKESLSHQHSVHQHHVFIISNLCHIINTAHHINSALTLLISHLVHLLAAAQQPLFINPVGQVCSSMLAYQPLLITLYYYCCHQLVLFYSLVTLCKCTVACSTPLNCVYTSETLLFIQIAYCLCNIVNALGHHPIMLSCHCLSCVLGCIITHHCSLIHAKVSSVKPVYVCCCTSGQFAMAGEDFKPELSL